MGESNYVKTIVTFFVGGLLVLSLFGFFFDNVRLVTILSCLLLLLVAKIVDCARCFVTLLEIVRLGFHLTEDPVVSVKLLLPIQEPLQLFELHVISHIETKSHRGVNLRVVDLFGRVFVVTNVVLFDLFQVERHCMQRVVRV